MAKSTKTSNEEKMSKDSEENMHPVSKKPSVLFPLIISLIVGFGLGMGVMLMQKGGLDMDSSKKGATETEETSVPAEEEGESGEPIPTETVMETATPTPTSTPVVTSTATPVTTPSIVTKSVVLEDPVGGNSFRYTFRISSADTIKKETGAAFVTYFKIKYASGDTFFVQQRYEAYNTAYDSFQQLTGNLGTYYRITYPGSPSAYSYVDSLNTVATCDSFDGTIMPPCGAGVYSIPSLNFMADFSCDASKTICDATMKTMEVVKL